MREWQGALGHAEALYCAEPVRLSEHAGDEALCDFCARPIGSADVECEIEARIGSQHTALRFHSACHEAWNATRRQNYF